MNPPTILVVEDNPVTRKMLRIALQMEGYTVLEAQDGRSAISLMKERCPQLVLQDLVLPDMSGLDLVKELRALPGGDEVPILAVSGFLSKLEQAKTIEHGFTDYLYKPVLPSVLLQIVKLHLPSRTLPGPSPGPIANVVLADDDPIQLKLGKLILEQQGFHVTTAEGGIAALEQIRRVKPDAIVSDILMPRLDGFRLCLAVRQDPMLAHIPVVLMSSAYTEDADRRLALGVGADHYVLRTIGLESVIEALHHIPNTGGRSDPIGSPELPVEEYTHRVIRQLERQVRSNIGFAHRLSVREAHLGILDQLSDAVTAGTSIDILLQQLLDRCLDAAGLSKGALFLWDRERGFTLHAHCGFPKDARKDLEALVHQYESLTGETGTARLGISPTPAAACERLMGKGLGKQFMTAPIQYRKELLGLLVFASSGRNLTDDWGAFADGLGIQLGETIVLSKAFASLRTAESKYRHIFDNPVVGIYQVNPAGRIILSNLTFARLLGFGSPEELMAGVSDINNCYFDPNGFTEIMKPLEQQNVVSGLECRLRRKDGSEVWLEQDIRTVSDEGGQLQYCEGIAQDITIRKRAEKELGQAEEQLRQAQKMEAVGRLAGGIAHDFNNLLMAINGFADLILMRVGKEDKTYGEVKQIKEAGQRASALTRQLLAFSRKQVLQPIVLDLNGVVKGIENMVTRLIGERIGFKTVLRSEKTVRADAGQIEQVIMNLAVNAMDAMPEGGKLTIETADVLFEGDDLHRHPQVAPGAYVMLAVSDTGCGMDKETQAHIFEPFFTTKEVGKGTGLGLSMVYGTIKQSGGYTWVYSEPGQGTTFKIYLPVVEEPAQKQEPLSGSDGLPGGTETVLLVEDEDRVRAFVQELLASVGYTVFPARDGEEAIAMCERNTGPIQLLLTDIVMPRISGPALAERLQALYPNMKVIYMSGYTEEADLQRTLLDHKAVFLQKPCSPAELAQRVREVLDAPPQFRR